jgi:transcriptional regulator with GAF, ATPase, and Fis domain
MRKRNPTPSSEGGSDHDLSELERLIVEFSAEFANLLISEIDGRIQRALEQIAVCLNLDRCAFWEVSESSLEVILIHQYVAEGLPKLPDAISYKYFPWFLKQAFNGHSVIFSRIEDLPEEAEKDKQTFRKLGTKSALLIPYYIAGKLVAGMTIATMKREIEFHRGLVTRLKLIGEIVAGALHRKKMEERYQKCVKEAQISDEDFIAGTLTLRPETQNEFRLEGIIGNSPPMQVVYSRIEQVAPTDSVVLIMGETGTGKGVIARAIHDLSRRKDQRIVMVNCAALTPNLIESELFGREKGAYTGSTEMQIGRFELADKGTLILDEITELPMDLQAKLLRAIQDGEFERLGSPKTIRVDVRIIALTSRNLKEEVAKGRFRQDLYYRLNVFPITMPPLRERTEDIPALAAYFLNKFSRKMQKNLKSVPQKIMAELMAYSWPGNVRELEHVIERAVILSQGDALRLAEKLTDSAVGHVDENEITNLAEVEKRHIIKILQRTNWRIEGPRGAAVLLGLHPNTLRGRMQKLGIKPLKKSF